MQEKDSKKSNPKKLRLIPNSDVRVIITTTHDAVNKHGKRTKIADTVLKLSHAYIDLSGAYKDVKKELSTLENSHGSRRELLKDLIGQLEGQIQGAAESVLEYEEEINALRQQNAGLLRRAKDLERQNDSLGKKLATKRQVDAVTGTPVKTASQEDYVCEDIEEDPEDEPKNVHKIPRVKHSSQTWKPAKPNIQEQRNAEAMRSKVAAAGDESTEDILRLLGE
jgi:chromosome segregation ATPase